MKRTPIAALLLAFVLSSLLSSSLAWAERLTLLGKSYCPFKEEVFWPFWTNKPLGQDKGYGMAISTQPDVSDNEKSAKALGSSNAALRILTVNIALGQPVRENQLLVTYELPLDQAIREKEALSRAKVDRLEQTLAVVNYKLAAVMSKRDEIKKGLSIDLASPGNVRAATREVQSLLKQREALTSAYEQSKARYENDLLLARQRFGGKLDLHHYPRTDGITAPFAGHVLWINRSLKPGMIMTKRTKLYTIGSMNPILVRAAVHESALHRLKIGDAATITFPSLPGEVFHSTISTINYVPQPAPAHQPTFYEIELSLENPALHIKDGMRCSVTVDLPD